MGLDVVGYDYRSHVHYEEDLLRLIASEEPRYFFTQKGEVLPPPLIERIRTRGCVTIYWCFDVAMTDWQVAIAKVHDFVATNVEGHVAYFKSKGLRNVRWVHQGFDPASFVITGCESPVTGPWYADVGMIGSMGHPLYRTRCERLTRLKKNGFNVKWWGRRLAREIRNVAYFAAGVHTLWAGKEVYAGDFTDVVRHVKIVIGQDADLPAPGRYLSNRSFSVPGCGGFYLARRTAGIESLFDIDQEVVVFDSDEEMIDKAWFYLTHEELRQRIALAGQKRVLTEYTYKNRMEELFRWVREHL